MAITKENFEKAKQIHNRLQMRLNSLTESKGMTAEHPEYVAAADDFNKFDRALRDYTSSQRKVDENGRLTEEPPTLATPSAEGEGEDLDTDYFYEPNVGEVQDFFRRNPQTMDRLGLSGWAKGINTPEKREPVLDPMSGAPQGWNVVPAVSYLDALTEKDSQYGTIADEMYRQKSEEAKRYKTNLKRYRDVHFKPGSKVDYVRGGAGWVGDRVAAPALMGVADAATLGQAAPLGDAITDLIDYEAGKRGYDIGPQPKAREVIGRNRPAYVAGQFAGYGLPRNPANLIQGELAGIGEAFAQRALGEAGKGFVPRAAIATGAGGLTSAYEGAVQDFANAANEGASYTDASKAAVGNLGMNAGLGGLAGGALDLGASGVNTLRQGYRATPRNAPLRTLEAAGGGAHIGKGVTAPEEIVRHYNESNKVGATGTAGDRAARAVAPDIERSLVKQGTDEHARIEGEMHEYFNHPDYNRIHKPTTPAIEALVDMSRGGFGRDAVDGARVAMDPPTMKKIGGILKQYARPVPVDMKAADAPAKAVGGIVIEPELATHLFGDSLDTGPILPGQAIVLHPVEVNAQGLTTLEDRIYRELNYSTTRGDTDDPVWNRFDKGIKDTRDQFPLYRDEAGKLVPPPPASVSQQPFSPDPEAARPSGEMRVLPPPERVAGGEVRKPPGLLAVGPGQPDLPSSPFDPRAGVSPGVAADQLPRPIGIGGEGMVARPEGLFGVGPGGPSVPENPFDARLPTSQESIRPLATMEVQGEYGPPPPLDPNARPGIGPHRRFEQHQPVEPQPTQTVQGDYNKPPEVERAPITERGMPKPKTFRIMVVENGQPRPVAGMRVANSPEEAASMVDTLNSYGTDEFVAQPVATKPPESAPKLEAPTDDRGGLEKMLDDKLEQAPKVPTEEIDEIGAAQTADREQVAQDQKDYVEDLFSPGREARAREMEKFTALAENPEVIEEAIAAVKRADERLGPIPDDQKRMMVIKMIEAKLGRKIDEEDLIRAGLIGSGMVQLATDDDDSGEGAAIAGMGFFGRGRKGTRSGIPGGPSSVMDDLKGASNPPRPRQLEFDDNGELRKGFSALRAQQHDRLTHIEKAKQRVGVGKDQTVEDRIRTFGQQEGRLGTDETLLAEAKKIGKERQLRTAAGAAVYPHLKARSAFGGNEGMWKATLDFFGLRAYKGSELLAGRFDNDNLRNPFVADPSTTSGKVMKAMVSDPARRLFDWSGGAQGARHGDDIRRIVEALQDDGYYEENKERRQRPAP